jgi:hypothetical protein
MKYEQPFGVSDPNASYINGNPSTGTMGSIPPAASIENPQREIVNFIADANLVPADTDLHQLGRSVQSNGVIYCDDQGTQNQLAITLSPPIIVKSPISNTGPSTLKVNALAPIAIVRSTDQAPLTLGDISANCLQAYGYDGTHFQMVWSQRQPGAPIYLTAPQTYYVNGTTGQDTYDGTTALVGGGHGPFKTIQKACNQIPLYNMNGYNVTINVADGTYANFVVPPQNGSGNVILNGNTSNPAACSVVGTNVTAILVRSGNYCIIDGFKVSASGPSTPGDVIAGVWAQLGGTWAYLEHMEFGTCTGPHMFAQFAGTIANLNPHSPWKITGNATYFARADGGGSTIGSNAFAGPDVTIPGAIYFSGAFIEASYAGAAGLVFGALTGAANVTGFKFLVSLNGVIVSGGGGVNYYPGTGAGTASSGGQYL